MKSSRRQRNPHTHDEQSEKTDFFSKTSKENTDHSDSSFFKTKPDTGSIQKKEKIQRLSTPKEDEKLGTNDARIAKDKEIQEKRIQKKSMLTPDKEQEQMTKTDKPVQRETDESDSSSDTSNSFTAKQQSCGGWESDPQSLSKRAAEHFCTDAFNTVVPNPDSVTCSGSSCVVKYTIGVFSHSITVDLSKVPGMVFVSGTPSLVLRSQTCSYSYSCEDLGAVRFTRLACRFT